MVSNIVSVVLVIGAMLALSWQLTLGSLLLVRSSSSRPSSWADASPSSASRQMSLNADMGTRMTERFNVAGALLVKLFGDPVREETEYDERASRVRDIGVQIAINRTVFLAALTLVAALATALIYGFGGVMAVNGTLTVGTLLAPAAARPALRAPDLAVQRPGRHHDGAHLVRARLRGARPQAARRRAPGRRPVARRALGVELDGVSFRYPSADEVSLASLEATASGDRRAGGEVLHGVSVTVEPGQLVALVGPSGAGKTTLTSLVARLLRPDLGAVRIGGLDLRDVTLSSLRDRLGVVTQEAHLFHDTIRANLLYARPDATEEEMAAALRAAQISDLVDDLPEGLDTVVGDRGHRLSGGEKQRLAIARLLLKAPDIVVLDEATAHRLRVEVAVQRALDAALTGRTSVVIAHRLSTIRQADLIVVLDRQRIVETGRHADLLAAGGLYAQLHATQFADSHRPAASLSGRSDRSGGQPGIPQRPRCPDAEPAYAARVANDPRSLTPGVPCADPNPARDVPR